MNDIVVNFCIEPTENAFNASAVIFNTFDDLEHEILEVLSSSLPAIYTIGLLQHLLNQVPADKAPSFIGSNYWVEEPKCMEWLYSTEPNPVIYVNLGSVTTMTDHQLIEFAWGLANSKKTFLWVIRSQILEGESAVLPPEFFNRNQRKRLLDRLVSPKRSANSRSHYWVSNALWLEFNDGKFVWRCAHDMLAILC